MPTHFDVSANIPVGIDYNSTCNCMSCITLRTDRNQSPRSYVGGNGFDISSESVTPPTRQGRRRRDVNLPPAPHAPTPLPEHMTPLADTMLDLMAEPRPRSTAARTDIQVKVKAILAQGYMLGLRKGKMDAAPALAYEKMWTRLSQWARRELNHQDELGTEESAAAVEFLKAMMLRMELMENEG